ncbi:hypothetical protein RN001_005775 [Aquatica leii]|uniref:Uncharacterized protein n=1 Tax=Aquatica leii TaxID=1421715 RepID=A0AAN7PKC0_9COLE|nr:hypothetical protein RN001_005775 [Aquatica leii]
MQSTNRSVKMLKIKYDGIKRIIKQKYNRCISDMFQTGGGSAEVTTYTSWEETLLRLISLNVEGLGSGNDSDQVEATAPETDIQVINNLCNDEVMEVVMLETETPVPTSSFTQTDIQV